MSVLLPETASSRSERLRERGGLCSWDDLRGKGPEHRKKYQRCLCGVQAGDQRLLQPGRKQVPFVCRREGRIQSAEKWRRDPGPDPPGAAVKTKDAVLTSKLSLTGQYGVLTLDGSGLGISSKIRDAGWKEQMKEWWEEEARGPGFRTFRNGTSACWLYPADQCVRRSPGGGRTGAVRPGRTDGQAS